MLFLDNELQIAGETLKTVRALLTKFFSDARFT